VRSTSFVRLVFASACSGVLGLFASSASVAQTATTQAVCFGYSAFDLRVVPPLAANVGYTGASSGNLHCVALRSDGTIAAWGNSGSGVLDVPALPVGTVYTAVSAGSSHNLALTSAGNIVAWGSNAQGQCGVPAAPAGVRYSAVSAGYLHSLALRSDGVVVAWGLNTSQQCSVPALPAGTTYVAVAAGEAFSLALRSDGRVMAFGANNLGQCNAPLPPGGGSFVRIAAGGSHALASTASGAVLAWGNNSYGQSIVPALPAGVTVSNVAAGHFHSLALRSDGQLAAWGQNFYEQITPPALPPGSSFSMVTAGHNLSLCLYSSGVSAGSAFTFQGHLQADGAAINGSVNLRFSLWDRSTGGQQAGPQIELAGYPVSSGLFSAQLDFGSAAFNGAARWVELSVQDGQSASFTTLQPRQMITPAPYATFTQRAANADTAGTAQSAASASSAQSVPWAGITGIPPVLNNGGPWIINALGDLAFPNHSIAVGTPVVTPGFRLEVAGSLRCLGVVQTSTAALKDNVQTIDDALGLVLSLRGVGFTWNDRAPQGFANRRDLGFIAEEVAKVIPEIVFNDESGTPIGLDYSRIVAVSVEAIKAQQHQIAAQQQTIGTLQAQHEAISNRLLALEAALAATNLPPGGQVIVKGGER